MPVKLFKPLKPLKPAEGYGSYEFDDIDELVEQFVKPLLEKEGQVIIQPKWDGIRLIVHSDGEEVSAYTEDRQRDRAEILPALVSEMKRVFGWHKVIVDGEILLGRIVDGQFKPVMRPDMMKVVVGKEPIVDPIRYMAFDLLYLDGEDLTSKPYLERLTKLTELVSTLRPASEVILLTESKIVSTVDEAVEAVRWAVQVVGSEGAMIKSLHAEYELDGRTTSWAKYKQWKALKCVIIGISKVFPPNTDPDEWEETFKKSKTYLFRCAVLGPDGKTLVPIESKRTLTDSDLQLRYVRAGETDPVTGKVVTKSEWRGRDDKRLWKMDDRFGHREPGEFAYGQTYAIKVEDGEPKLGQLVEVAPIALNWFADDDGFVHLTWMHPRVISVGTDDPSEVADWDRVIELTLASGQDTPNVVVVDGKLKLADADSQVAKVNIVFAKDFSAKGDSEDEEDEEDSEPELGTPDKPLPKLFSNPFGISLSTVVVKAVARCIPEHRRYVELFSGTSPLIRAKPRDLSEEEILVELDDDVVALLKTIKSGEWRRFTRYNWRLSKKRWMEYQQAIREGTVSGFKRIYYWAYVTLYSLRGYAPVAVLDRAKLPGKFRFKGIMRDAELFFEHCKLWEERLKGVKIVHGDAFDALEKYDSKTTFFFADPPWEYDRKQHFYRLNTFDHERFAEAVSDIDGKIIIVGLRGQHGKYRKHGFSIRRIAYETTPPEVLKEREDAPHVIDIDKDRYVAKRRLYIIANFELPPARKIIVGSVPADEGEELTHEEQRLEEERRFGDSWKVIHDVKNYPDGYRAVYMRHYRGLWSPEQVDAVSEIVGRIIESRDDTTRRELFNRMVKEFGCAVLLEDYEDVIEKAQEASAKRDDVSVVIEKYSTDDYDEALEHIDSISELRERVVNFVSVHGDLRIQNPQSPERQLIGLTLMTPAAAFQFIDGRIIPVLRDKFLFNQESDRIVAVKKARQPFVWLDVVNPKQPLLWAPPSAAGATRNAWALFEWHAFMRVWFVMQRPDYHEIYIKFDELASDEYTVKDGKWVMRLLEGEGPKIGGEGLYWQFWYPERDGQLPYVLTHTPSEAKRRWKNRKYDYIVMNLPVIKVLPEHFEELDELIESKRKATEQFENLDKWQELERT